MRSAVPKPQSKATAFNARSLASSIPRAASTRARSTNSCGVIPISCTKWRNRPRALTPTSPLPRAATHPVRDTEDDLLFNHSRRVFFWGALTGERRDLKYDSELLYLAAMFHDMELPPAHANPGLRFEVDGANAARDFMTGYGVSEREIEDVWTTIALHTIPGVPEHMRPTIALTTAGVEMDVLGAQGIIGKPDTTFGNVKADVLALKDPENFVRGNFCSIILGSA